MNPILAPPKAGAMLESLRGLGYSVPAALADIIDNSISADAGRVRIDFIWNGEKSAVRIIDDGSGMGEEDLDRAMRLGSTSPMASRSASDLGRFGMGLKTASLSQCRRLTVGSQRGHGNAYRRWDLDFIARSGGDCWHLLPTPAEGSLPYFAPLEAQSTGTAVLWEICDHIVTPGFTDKDFLDLADRVEQHLAMVFHRYLEGPSPRLRIFINGDEERHRVRPWDPFMSGHAATLWTPVERISTGQGTIEVQGHVLPHRDRIRAEDFEVAGGPEGWAAQQGFYVYRNQRLLVAGGWLGLGSGRAWTKEEAHKLARIRLDIPNTADEEWKIDIRKAVARPPVTIRRRLMQLAEKVRSDARRVFAHRGQYGAGAPITDLVQAWRVQESTRGVRYLIDESHPAVRCVLDQAGDLGPHVRMMLRIIEESVPVQRIWLDTVERGDVPLVANSEQAPPELLETLADMYRDLVGRTGLLPEIAVQQLLRTAPFNRWPSAVLELPARVARGET
jgi:hypothetical protein